VDGKLFVVFLSFGKKRLKKEKKPYFSHAKTPLLRKQKTSLGIGKSWAMARSFKHFLCHA